MSYCPFASMLCSRRSNNLVNNIPERALRATFDDHTSNFTQLLEKKRESTIPSTHERNLQTTYLLLLSTTCSRMNFAMNVLLLKASIKRE